MIQARADLSKENVYRRGPLAAPALSVLFSCFVIRRPCPGYVYIYSFFFLLLLFYFSIFFFFKLLTLDPALYTISWSLLPSEDERDGDFRILAPPAALHIGYITALSPSVVHLTDFAYV